MKIVLTTAKPDLDSEVDPRFGRCTYLLRVDTETLEWRAFPNPGASASGGAGTLAAQFVASQNAEAVISGDFGPNACAVLQAAGIPMYLYGQARTGREAVERFKENLLTRASGPTGPMRHRQF